MEKKYNIVIVGGGTAGWLSAARFAAALGPNVGVTLIESPTVPTIGVGEGTWPSMRTTLQATGLSEREVIQRCDASFKQGTLFRGWVTGQHDDVYMHPFSLPADYSVSNLADWWQSTSQATDFCQLVTPQMSVALANKAPKSPQMPDYAFALNYGYHIDAGKFAQLLHEHSVQKLGVVYVSADVMSVEVQAGQIEQLILSNGSAISADLFIDCTGQKALLIGQYLESSFVSMSDTLPNNRAVVTQVPYVDKSAEIASCTLSTAQSCGWVWDIGLQSRRGVGFVHNSTFVNVDEASSILLEYVANTSGKDIADSVKTRVVDFEPGYRPQPWLGNCVAIGLSAGFIEPLEASALAMIEQGISLVLDNFPHHASLFAPAARTFNQKMQENWQSIQEFLALHYALSQRDDSEYWRRARSPERFPERLRDKLQLWQYRAPSHRDAPRYDELFPAASYQYVWLGMKAHQFNSQPLVANTSMMNPKYVDRLLHDVREKTMQLTQSLPSNRALVDALIR
ncbi:MAG TPA: tryptophan halogenase family protein [Pseudomonadales bacterium]|nr:tryptophan halogenase family protein [Pseudomonadales bacterium]